MELTRQPEPSTLFGLRPTPLPVHPTRSRSQDRLLSTGDLVREHDHAGARAEDRSAARREVQDRRVKPPALDELTHRRALATGEDQPAEEGLDAPPVGEPDRVLDRPKTPLAGFYEALVQSWRDRSAAVAPAIRSPLLREWIDEPAWQRALGAGDPADVMTAWRVLQLDAWLTERAGPAEVVCTA